MQPKIFPRSEVGVANTRTPLPAIVKIPTVFSGLDYQFSKKKKKSNHKILIRYIQIAHITKKWVVWDLGFGTTDEINGVGLGLESGGQVIAVSHPF